MKKHETRLLLAAIILASLLATSFPFAGQNEAVNAYIQAASITSHCGTFECNSGWITGSGRILLKLLFAAGFETFGLHEWVPLAINRLFAIGAILMTYLLGRKLYSEKTGLIGAAILAATPQYQYLGYMPMFDMAALFFFLTGIYFFMEEKTALLAASMLLLFLTKETGMLIVPVLFAGTFLLGKNYKTMAAATAIALLLTAGTYIAAEKTLHTEKLAEGYAAYTFEMLTYSEKEISAQPSLAAKIAKSAMFYYSDLMRYDAPLNIILAAGALAVLPYASSRDAKTKWLAAWFIFFVTFLSLLNQKTPYHRFFLPSMPAAAILLAERARGEISRRKGMQRKMLMLLAAALLVYTGMISHSMAHDWSRKFEPISRAGIELGKMSQNENMTVATHRASFIRWYSRNSVEIVDVGTETKLKCKDYVVKSNVVEEVASEFEKELEWKMPAGARLVQTWAYTEDTGKRHAEIYRIDC